MKESRLIRIVDFHVIYERAGLTDTMVNINIDKRRLANLNGFLIVM